MKNDPRHQNDLLVGATVWAYLTEYAELLARSLAQVNPEALEHAKTAIEGASHAKKRVYSIGNGGSAAIADHLCCDLTKGTHHEAHPTISAFSMTSNVALYSAIANDFGFEKVFSTQVQFSCHEGDVLIAVSSSGNSPNIVQAVLEAKKLGVTTIGLSGFSGGLLKETADISLHVPVSNYGVVEDGHQAIMHVFAQLIARDRDQPASDTRPQVLVP